MVALYELVASQGGSVELKGAASQRIYLGAGTTYLSTMYAYTMANTPLFWNNIFRIKVELHPKGLGNLWDITVDYGVPDATTSSSDDNGAKDGTDDGTRVGPEYSFDTTAATVHITQSIATPVAVLAGGGVPSDYKHAIGISREKVEGTDIFAPKFEFTNTYNFAYMNLSYLKVIRDRVATTNNASFRGFAAGEVLFLGSTGQYNTNNGWSISYKFAVGKNQANIVISPDITVPTKNAWDYLWVGYGDNADSGTLIQKPISARVEQVYNSSDFSKLLIGV